MGFLRHGGGGGGNRTSAAAAPVRFYEVFPGVCISYPAWTAAFAHVPFVGALFLPQMKSCSVKLFAAVQTAASRSSFVYFSTSEQVG